MSQVWDAEASPWPVALLGRPVPSFIFIFKLLYFLAVARPVAAPRWARVPRRRLGAEPLARGLASQGDTLIKAIYNHPMELPSPAGEHFPITWAYLLSLICH